MSALTITLRDLSASLRKLAGGERMAQAALARSAHAADAIGGTAHLVRDGEGLAVEFVAPRLFEREYGTHSGEGDQPLSNALREANR